MTKMNKQYLQERNELDLLNGKNGLAIETRLFGKRKIWKATFFPLGLMDRQSQLYHRLKLDKGFYDNTAPVTNVVAKAVRDNAKICAEIIAITVLGKPWKIFLFKWCMKRHFLWQVDSGRLLAFTNDLFKANRYTDFMTSIALMSVSKTTTPTKADAIEDLGAPTE